MQFGPDFGVRADNDRLICCTQENLPSVSIFCSPLHLIVLFALVAVDESQGKLQLTPIPSAGSNTCILFITSGIP